MYLKSIIAGKAGLSVSLVMVIANMLEPATFRSNGSPMKPHRPRSRYPIIMELLHLVLMGSTMVVLIILLCIMVDFMRYLFKMLVHLLNLSFHVLLMFDQYIAPLFECLSAFCT